MTGRMAKEKGHYAVRRYLDILKDRSRYNVGGFSLAMLATAKVYSGSLVG